MARTDQCGDGVVDIRDAIGRFGRSLVAADGGLAMQMAGHGVDDRPGRQSRAGVVEVKDIVGAMSSMPGSSAGMWLGSYRTQGHRAFHFDHNEPTANVPAALLEQVDEMKHLTEAQDVLVDAVATRGLSSPCRYARPDSLEARHEVPWCQQENPPQAKFCP